MFFFFVALLHIDDEDDSWMDFALHLGFTEEQVEQELATEQDPILAILNLYKRQGRNAKEFLQVGFVVKLVIRVF